MIGITKDELEAIIGEVEEKAKATFSKDPLRTAWVDAHVGTLSLVAQLIADNNRRLYEDLVALGVLKKNDES